MREDLRSLLSKTEQTHIERQIFLKLLEPQSQANSLLRPRLTAKLDSYKKSKLTLICAPAGFGKTTLVADWLKSKNILRSWFVIDQFDNHRVFISYFITALQQISPQIGKNLDDMSIKSLDIFTIMTTLITDISRVAAQGVLVLDNYHFIDLPEIHQFMSSFIDFLPPQLRLVIICRDDKHLSLGRLRLQNQVIEIRTPDLRFTTKEIKQLLNQNLSLNLSSAELFNLEILTNGWPAAIQMAVLFIQNQESGSDRLAGFNSRHRFVSEFIEQEVWNDLRPGMQKFLITNSVLDQLNPELCNTVSGIDNSAHILTELYRCNLFITSVDNQNNWFCFHPLFSDFLKQKLDFCDRLESHRKASEWFENNNNYSESIRHALAAGDLDRMTRLINNHSISLLEFGKISDQIEKFNTISKKEIESLPWLCISYAWILMLSGRLERVDELMICAEKSLDPSTQCLPQEDFFPQLLLIKAFRSYISGDFKHTENICVQALDGLKSSINEKRSLFSRLLGLVKLINGQFIEAEAILESGFYNASALDDYQNMGIFSLYLAFAKLEQGYLRDTEESLKRLVQLSNSRENDVYQIIFPSGLAFTKLGLINFEWNQVENARRLVLQGIMICEQNGKVYDLIDTYLDAIRMLDKVGDTILAESLLEKALLISRKISSHYQRLVQLAQIRHLLSIGKLSAAVRKWDELHPQDSYVKPAEYHEAPEGLIFAQLLIQQSSYVKADEILQKIQKMCEEKGARHQELEVLLLLTESAYCQGLKDKADQCMDKALEIGSQEGYLTSFLSNPVVLQILEERSESPTASTNAYRKQILVLAHSISGISDASTEKLEQEKGNSEALSDRELEILDLINNGFTNQEISEKLVISLGTTKWHIVNIFSKFGVHSRTQAILKGKALNILQNKSGQP